MILYVITDRGRSRKRKRDFFGTIRRKLNRSKVRSRSMDPGEYDDSMNTDAVNRSISADRARDPSVHSTGNNLILFYFKGLVQSFTTMLTFGRLIDDIYMIKTLTTSVIKF